MSWLDDLEVGDKVIVEKYNTVSRITTVVRLTKTRQVVVDGVDGRFKDGALIGSGSGYSSYVYIREWTQEKEDAIRRQVKRNRLVNILSDVNFDVLDDEQLETVSGMVTQYIEEHTAARKGDIVTYTGRGRHYDRRSVEACKIISTPRLHGRTIMVNLDKVGSVNVESILWED